ncbi:pur operon repressor [Facklamia sp. DSM 111018]|uniref:Pur operon repressor n=1 Tax=Facklamia lactis TaxID=2749967 RepID=A0ABS0LT08_9LACT|nr:pur operon repressor [Facklamia lactis]MBG9981432.1 pur operon repressor [Facklamia lactis]MBG9987092.1 pur operon repressor [Facklamia lactis]
MGIKYKRNQRLIAMTHQLLRHPNQLMNLQSFADQFSCAKSSISEDIEMIRQVYEENQMGMIETLTGKTGGVIFRPQLSTQQIEELKYQIRDRMQTGQRILPGNYIYVNDLLQDPDILNNIAQLIASYYAKKSIDVVLTIEAKGIGLSVAVANFLNVPYVVVRRKSSTAEGSTISINYISGSHQTVKKMELSKNSLPPGSRVLIVDDFLRNGGTIIGLANLIAEFDSEVAGICVFAENKAKERMEIPDYQSLFETKLVFDKKKKHYTLQTQAGNFLENFEQA